MRSTTPLPFALFATLLLPLSLLAAEIPNPDIAGLPPRTVASQLAPRPIPDWLQTHLRVGHLPGSLTMGAEFVKAGYDVVTLNVLGNWEVVGPSANLYPPERVKEIGRAHV